MKRIPYVSLFVVLAATAAASAQDPQKPLIWGADADGGVPYVFADPENPEKVIGFEVDIAEALARELRRPIQFQQRKFSSLLSDIERGDIDLAMNGIEILPQSLNLVRFTKPYYLYHLQLVVRADSKFETLADIKAHELTVGTLEGAAAVGVLEFHKIAVRPYADQDGPYADLLRDPEIGAVLLDLPAAIYYAAPDRTLRFRRTQPGLRFAGQPFAEGLYGIAVKKDNAALQTDLDAALDRLRDSGELKRILQKWELWTPDQYRLAVDPSVVAAESGMTFSKYFPLLLEGAGMTIKITIAGMLLAMALGLPIALLRLYGSAPLRWAAVGYVEFFRGIPVLLLLYFLYYGLPTMIAGFRLDAFSAAVIGFGLNYAAYEAEIYRTGIGSIPVGQWEAAGSLGMSSALTFRRIILPQAIRVILPPMTNDLVALFKDTSVVSIIAVVELSNRYQILTKSGGGYLQIGLITAGLYLMMSVPLGYLSRYLEHRWGGR